MVLAVILDKELDVFSFSLLHLYEKVVREEVNCQYPRGFEVPPCSWLTFSWRIIFQLERGTRFSDELLRVVPNRLDGLLICCYLGNITVLLHFAKRSLKVH
jgi:hypothetical protein